MTTPTRFQYNDINYQVLTQETAQVGYGYEDTPYTSAVDVNYINDINIPSYVFDQNNHQYKVTVISKHAFFICQKIKRFTVSYTVEVIEWSALAIDSLEELIFESNSHLREVGDDLVHRCTKLKYLALPPSIEIIGIAIFRTGFNSTFYYCGQRKFTTQFVVNDKIKLPPVHVPMNYLYKTFGNLQVIKDNFCQRIIDCTIYQQRIFTFKFISASFLLFALSF